MLLLLIVGNESTRILILCLYIYIYICDVNESSEIGGLNMSQYILFIIIVAVVCL
jgi:hypothetical protein